MEMTKEGGLWNTADPFGSASAPKQPAAESMSRTPSMDAYIRGYKDVPSLSAIRDRMGSLSSARQFLRSEADSLNGVTVPIKEESTSSIDQYIPELITPSITAAEAERVGSKLETDTAASASTSTAAAAGSKRKDEHALRHAWTLYFDSKTYKPHPEMVEPKEGEHSCSDYEKSLVTVGKLDTVSSCSRC